MQTSLMLVECECKQGAMVQECLLLHEQGINGSTKALCNTRQRDVHNCKGHHWCPYIQEQVTVVMFDHEALKHFLMQSALNKQQLRQ